MGCSVGSRILYFSILLIFALSVLLFWPEKSPELSLAIVDPNENLLRQEYSLTADPQIIALETGVRIRSTTILCDNALVSADTMYDVIYRVYLFCPVSEEGEFQGFLNGLTDLMGSGGASPVSPNSPRNGDSIYPLDENKVRNEFSAFFKELKWTYFTDVVNGDFYSFAYSESRHADSPAGGGMEYNLEVKFAAFGKGFIHNKYILYDLVISRPCLHIADLMLRDGNQSDQDLQNIVQSHGGNLSDPKVRVDILLDYVAEKCSS